MFSSLQSCCSLVGEVDKEGTININDSVSKEITSLCFPSITLWFTFFLALKNCFCVAG